MDTSGWPSTITSTEQGGRWQRRSSWITPATPGTQFDPADSTAVAEAEARFQMLTGAGFTAAKRTGSGVSELIREFDPTVEETLFIPRLKGG